MKRIIFTVIVVFVFPLLISSRVFAYTQEELELFKTQYNELYNVNATETFYSSVLTQWENNLNNSNNKLYTLVESNMYYVFDLCNSSTRITGNNFQMMSGDTTRSTYKNNIYTPNASDFIFSTSSYTGVYNNSSPHYWGTITDWRNSQIDYENPLFSSAIPVPEMMVTYVGVGLTLPTNQNGVYVDCIVEENEAFYIQLQAKYSVADMVNVLLNDGVITYDYLDWYDGDNIDIYGLQDNQSSVHVTASEFQTSWNTVINSLLENSSFPTFTSNVPFWVANPDADKFVNAKNRYRNVLMRQAPMYGSRMELFARYYAIVDGSVYVGRWIHWNSINPSNTEELSNQYQVDQPFPGYQNTSDNVNLPSNDNTYTNMGESTNVNQNPYTQVIVNNNVPNYPDYPTVATYNHDNILVQFINTAKMLPNFFGDFGSFLTTSFAFIPSYIWAVIGFGFMCSIVIMIIKVL